MSRRGENIYKRKDQRWEGRIKVGIDPAGNLVYKSVYGHSYNDIRSKVQGLLPEPMPVNPNIYLDFSGVCNEWLEHIRPTIKQSTFSSYYRIVHHHIARFFSSESMSKITRQRIDTMTFILLRDGGGKKEGGLSVGTVNTILIVLKSIFAFAEKNYPVDNPIRNLKLPRHKTESTVVFTDYEWSRIADLASEGKDETCMAIEIAMYTGMRIGELCALKKEDIDFNEHIIHIQRTVQRVKDLESGAETKTKIIMDIPKSKTSWRRIPIPDILKQTLERLCRGKRPESYILGIESTRALEPRTLQYRFQVFLKRAGLVCKNFHVLRHTFATRCVEKNVDVKTLSEILGHTSVKITLEKYVHSSMEFKRVQINRLNNVF